MGLNDFDSIAQEKAGVAGASVSNVNKRKLDTGESREYLKVFETLPPQLPVSYTHLTLPTILLV